MTQNYTKWSTTPANNTAAPPDGAPAGIMPSASEGIWRELMAEVAILGNAVSTSGYIWVGTLGGTGLAYTATIAPVLSSFAYANGITVRGIINTVSTGAATLNLTGPSALGAKPIYRESASGPVAVAANDLPAGQAVTLVYDTSLGASGGFHAMEIGGNLSIGFVQNYITGLKLSNNSGTPNTKVDVAAGQAADSANAVMMSFTGSAKTVDFGTSGAGGLDTGSIGASKSYSILLIFGSSGTSVMATIDTAGSAISPTMPSGYTQYRRLGSVLTDSSSHILAFTQIHETFYLATQIQDVNVTTSSNSSVLYTLSVPLGVNVQPLTRVVADSTQSNFILLSSPLETDVGQGGDSTVPGYDISAATHNVANFPFYTGLSGQIRVKCGTASRKFQIVTRGWIDSRGRFG